MNCCAESQRGSGKVLIQNYSSSEQGTGISVMELGFNPRPLVEGFYLEVSKMRKATSKLSKTSMYGLDVSRRAGTENQKHGAPDASPFYDKIILLSPLGVSVPSDFSL